jgi:hypothetical protein
MRLAHAVRNVIFIGVKSVFGACLGEFIVSHQIFPEVSRLLYSSTFLALRPLICVPLSPNCHVESLLP